MFPAGCGKFSVACSIAVRTLITYRGAVVRIGRRAYFDMVSVAEQTILATDDDGSPQRRIRRCCLDSIMATLRISKPTGGAPEAFFWELWLAD